MPRGRASPFLAAYRGQDPSKIKLPDVQQPGSTQGFFPQIPIPDWRFNYNGLKKIPIIKKTNGKNQRANVLNLRGGLRRIKSPYLSVKKLYISLSFFPSFILFLIKIRKSLASGALESSID